MRVGFSIRYKILLVISFLLMLSVAIYLMVATTIVRGDKEAYVFDSNEMMVKNLSSDISSQFAGYTDKMQIFALFSKSQKRVKQIVTDLMQNDSSIVYMNLLKQGDSVKDAKSFQEYQNGKYLETYGLGERFFSEQLSEKRPVPFEEILQDGFAVWNATVKDGPPLLGLGRSVIEEGPGRVPVARYAVVSYVRSDRILSAIQKNRINEIFVIDKSGRVLVHKDMAIMSAQHRLGSWEQIQKSAPSTARSLVTKYEYNGKKMLGAFSKSYGNKVIVFAKTSEGQAFSVVNRLMTRSLFFGLIIITLAFLAAILFSRHLTRPIQTLVKGMGRVSEGDLNTQITVQTQDEISALAGSFNSMISDLKESREQLEEINRNLEDKVKDRTRQLEEQNQAVKQAQEALLQTSRLAAVGEIAGRAAHEVLNPLTSLLTRVERVKKRYDGPLKEEVSLFEEIRQAWATDYQEGGLDKLKENWEQPSTVKEGWNLWQEDLANLEGMSVVFSKELEQMQSDTKFLMKEGHRINSIVNSMRSLSAVKGARKSVQAHDLLHDSVNIMADLFNQDEVLIIEDYKADHCEVKVDKDEFIQAMTNLLRNSLQAINEAKRDSGKGQVMISTFTEGNEKLVIDIEDNGVGISQDNQSKLFKNQFSTKSPETGTGLGLSISRRFIRGFGGDMFLHLSVPGESTVFRIELPLNADDKKKEVAA